MILNATLKADYEPGSNQSQDLVCDDWRFLLPSMELEKILCIGSPKYATLNVLSLMSKKVFIVHSGDSTGQSEQRQESLDVAIVQNYDDIFFEDKSVSLIILSSAKEVTRVFGDQQYVSELFRILKPEGILYLEYKGIRSIFQFGEKFEKMLQNDLKGSHQTFWLTPTNGEMQTALPVKENDISSFFFENVLFGQSLTKRILSRAGRVLSQMGLISYAISRRAMLIQNSPANGKTSNLPHFLRELARQSGLNIDHFRFGLSARGRYNSNKIIYYLFDRHCRSADIIIKMTRISHFNCRLEHEYEMLLSVQKKRLVDPDSFPAPLFFGHHNGLSILGQKAMKGHPFRTQATAKPDCPIAADALNWIITLGKNSKNTELASSLEVSEALFKLFDIFTSIYQLSARHIDFLKQQISDISFSRHPFPLVFCHGDAGNWNVVVSRERKAQFLDWEAAEPVGMPLWDLFYFIGGFGNWIARKQQGNPDKLKSFQQHFLQPSDLSDLLAKVTSRYCDEVGLDKRLVAPMFYTCWMHRALRQATWAESLQQAYFVSVIRLCIDNYNSPGISSLFTL